MEDIPDLPPPTPEFLIRELRDDADLDGLMEDEAPADTLKGQAADMIERMMLALRRIEAGDQPAQEIAGEAINPWLWALKKRVEAQERARRGG